MTSPVRSASGVSLGKSDVSVSAGLSSAHDVSDKARSSNAFLGVVKAGLRNGGAAARDGS